MEGRYLIIHGIFKNLVLSGFEMLPIMTFLNNILSALERTSTGAPADAFPLIFP